MALLSFVDSTPRAYRLKAGNAASKISTAAGTSPVTHSEGTDLLYSVSDCWRSLPPRRVGLYRCSDFLFAGSISDIGKVLGITSLARCFDERVILGALDRIHA